jgi:CRP/FNR family transcriptional regulator
LRETIPSGEVIARLREVPFLQALSDPVLDAIRREGTVSRYGKGEQIFQRGQAPLGLLIVVQGSVRVYQIGDTGREQVLTVEQPGNSVAELPLFDGEPYPAFAEAAEPTALFRLGRDHFGRLLIAHPELAEQVIRALAMRLRRLVRMVEDLGLREVRQRVAALLVRLAEEHGPEFALPASNEQIAAQLGTVREVVSRALHGFAHDRLIELEGRQVQILDLPGLRDRA